MKKKDPNIKIRKATLISGISLILGFLFDYFFYDKLPGVAFPLYILLILLCLFTIAHFLKRKVDKQITVLSIPLIFFSIMVFIHTSPFLTLLNILVSIFLLLLIIKTLYGKKIENFLIKDYVRTLFLPLNFIPQLFGTLSEFFSSLNFNKNQKVFSQIIKGVVITIPIIFVLILLFSSADLVFQKYVSYLFTLDINPEIFFRFILILIVTFIFIGAFSYIFQESKQHETIKQENKKYIIGDIESSIILGSINVLFLLFILVQLTYLFGGENNISAQGFTYAEYARRGFFELIIVAVISLLLLLVIEKYVVKWKEKHIPWFKILSTAMILQVVIIMVSAFMRLLLYEEAYGFTTLRLYSHSFLILLAVIFCLLIYKIYRNKTESVFVFQIFVSAFIFLAGMNFLNPDRFIAQQNIKRFSNTENLDVYYLANLSDDAIPEIVKALDTLQDEESKNRLGGRLYLRSLEDNGYGNWQSFNISRTRAKRILDLEEERLKQYKGYYEDYYIEEF